MTDDLEERIMYALVGSCSCGAKTNDPKYHNRFCLYSILNAVMDKLKNE